MANFCLLPQEVDKFKKALKDKELDIPKLLNMSTEARTQLLSEYVGESSSKVNTLFEEKLVLKNKMVGLKNWASKVGQIGRYDPAKKALLDKTMSEFRAMQQERILSPKEEETFLNDLADKVMGTHITKQEASTVFELSKKTEDLLQNYDQKTGTWKSDKDRLEYGASKVVLEKYTQGLADDELSVKDMLKSTLAEFKATGKENAPKAVIDLLGKGIQTVFDNAIALTASVDNSFMGRQGLSVLMTNPKQWWSGAINSFKDFGKTMTGNAMDDALLADVYSRPNYLNGSYENAGFIGKTEEQFPTSLPERIPYIGRIFKASEVAFSNSALRMRTSVYDKISEQVSRNGVDMTSKENQQGLGTVISSLTARGQWGKRGDNPLVRLLLWSPKMLKGNIDVLTAHAGQDIPPFARKIAAQNLAKIIGVTSLVLGMMKAISPDDVELDPRSANFGKVRVRGNWIDITGGKGSIITLVSRLLTNSTKSSQTGVTNKLNTGEFGSRTKLDVFIDFITGKVSPGVGIIVDMMKGEMFGGKPVTLLNELTARGVPLSVQKTAQIKEADNLFGVIADIVGFGSSNLEYSNKDWNKNISKELQTFKDKVGQEAFDKANQEYNDLVNQKIVEKVLSTEYKELSNDDKKKAISKLLEDTKKTIINK